MLISQDEMPLVAMEFMNAVHSEDIGIINELFALVVAYDRGKSSIEAINDKYQEWIAHTVEHFRGEEVMMIEKGFPPYAMHKGEHDRALDEMKRIFQEWQKTMDSSVLKIYLIEIVPLWLTNHIASMDTVTARFFDTGFSPCGIAH
ncbi:MAG: hypothetical protein KU38_06435 [Sulfurovum sp. FS08-3]|nr:MAG: hypothetical protein KU38_06435 [Sulfurovum sp. FS08-3]